MKKILLMLLACMFIVSAASAENLSWQPVVAEAQVLPKDAQDAFDKATEKLTGAVYTPVALLSTQLGTGINYCILCQITPIVLDAVPTWNLVYIHADPDGNAEITNVWEIYIDRHTNVEEAAGQPIGVYDSGMGGLIVLESMIEAFPEEDFVFIADNAHVPYGTKTSDQIEEYNLELSEYLMEEENVKAICIACNTASANSSKLDVQIPVIKAIGPTAGAAGAEVNPDRNNILILATELTTKMGVYEKELDKYFAEVPHNYYSVATQNFVTMVEEGRYGTEESMEEVRETLKDYLDLEIDKIVLGCTHFPKLAAELSTLFPGAQLYGAGEAMSQVLRSELEEQDLLNDQEHGSITLITTGDLESFIEQTSWFKYVDQAEYKKIDLDEEELAPAA